MNKNYVFKSLITFLSALGLISCASVPVEPAPSTVSVTGISLNIQTANLKIGETLLLEATVYPNDASNKEVNWTISDNTVVSFSNNIVTALKAGEATITATTNDGGFSDTCSINVIEDDVPISDTIVNSKYLLNAYGDYFEYIDSYKDSSKLVEEYASLTKEKKYFSNGIMEAKYQVGLYEFFNIENKVDIKVNISSSELRKIDNDYSTGNKETYRICDLDILYRGLHFHYEEVGIRQKGNTSRGAIFDGDKINLRHYKLSFEETFDDEYTESPKTWISSVAKEVREDRTFFGIDKIDFRWNRNEDKTYLKEYYAFEMHRNNGSLAPRSNPVHFSMNVDGSEQNMGIYLAVETISKGFIKKNFV